MASSLISWQSHDSEIAITWTFVWSAKFWTSKTLLVIEFKLICTKRKHKLLTRLPWSPPQPCFHGYWNDEGSPPPPSLSPLNWELLGAEVESSMGIVLEKKRQPMTGELFSEIMFLSDTLWEVCFAILSTGLFEAGPWNKKFTSCVSREVYTAILSTGHWSWFLKSKPCKKGPNLFKKSFYGTWNLKREPFSQSGSLIM